MTPRQDPDTRRTWRLPPAPRHGDGELEGLGLLREMPDDLGAFLWQTLRSVTVWAAAEADRTGVFTPDAERLRAAELARLRVAEIREPLGRLTGLLGAPATTPPAEVAAACEAVADWAGRHGNMAAHLEFTRAAALATPEHAGRAVSIGKLTRDIGEYPLAEAWLQRAVALGRRSGDWEAYARAYVALGKLWFRRGRYPLARRHLEKALRAAARHGLRWPQAMANHDLFNLEMFSRRFTEALRFASEAARLYDPRDPALPALAYDVAYQWVEQGDYTLALPVLVALRPRFEGRERMVAEGGVARASGELGLVEMHAEAARAVLAVSDEVPNKASVLIEVARGAAALGDAAGVERALGVAEALAERFREARVSFLAEEVRAVLRDRETNRRMEPEPHPPVSQPAADLSRQLAAALAG